MWRGGGVDMPVTSQLYSDRGLISPQHLSSPKCFKKGGKDSDVKEGGGEMLCL